MVLFQKCVRRFGPSTKMAPTAELSLTQDPMGNSHKNLLVWNQLLNWNQTLIKQSLDGPLPKLCPAVALSHQDGHHSAVALLLKAALIQVSDYRLLGASGLFCFLHYKFLLSYSRIMANSCCSEKLKEPEFDIGRNTLDLIYSQALCWQVHVLPEKLLCECVSMNPWQTNSLS